MQPTPSSRLWHGVSWYPELAPERIDADLERMRERGLSVVRLGDSCWSTLEPDEGHYDLTLYQRALDRIAAHGLHAILCTPSYTPPRWLALRYPGVLRVDRDGQSHGHGGRGHGSYASTRFRELACGIATVMAHAWGRHPALLGWQIDNEVNCHVDGDWSVETRIAWDDWLRRRFGTIAALNHAWQTRVWSLEYASFAEVQMPGKNPFGHTTGTSGGTHHTGLMQAWGEFHSDLTVGFVEAQAAALRVHSPAPITHNHIQLERTRSADLFRRLDFAATDSYWWADTARNHWHNIAVLRGLGKPWWLMETSANQSGGGMPGPLKPAGFLRAEAALFYGAGGTGFLYWHWRQHRGGQEQGHGALRTAWDLPAPGWDEVRRVSDLIERCGGFLTSCPAAPAEIAVHDPFSSKQYIGRGGAPMGDGDAQWTYRRAIDQELLPQGWLFDRLPEDGDPSPFRVVLSPWMPVLWPETLERMLPWVRAGGTWVVGPVSAIRDRRGSAPADAGFGLLEAHLGATCLWTAGMSAEGDLAGRPVKLSGFCAALQAGTAEVLGRYTTGYGAGQAWLTRQRVGAGSIVMIAAPGKDLYGPVIEMLLEPLGVRRFTRTAGAVVLARSGQGQRGWVLVELHGTGAEVELPDAGTDLLTGEVLPAGPRHLGPFEVRVVRC